jgi:hypothetical protein
MLRRCSTIANTAQRPSWRVHAAVGSVAHSSSGVSVVIRPVCRRLERLRTCGVGASRPASRISRSTRLRLVQMPRSRSRAVIFLWPSPTNGDSAISRRIAARSSGSGIAPTGPERRRAHRAPGSERLRRRRCSHAADLETPATRHTRASGASSRSATFSASATEGGGPSPRSGRAGCRCPSPAPRSCAAPRRAGGPPPPPGGSSGPRGRRPGSPHASG